ncbi:putative porin [Algoriphagus halophytocola]|uniref:Porin n=1 Tax=Algoriphagus halophytocola TaxID=2991499 RepID=A0ABY6MJV8_9BACT|nr:MULTISPECIES: putative porin [unclassified Algoriphagus]UZD24066.1 putative porin [Algoriphagus sp. TR-M5]WBL41437.1 putative porin [Algoriphagus sp. TR-M9]
MNKRLLWFLFLFSIASMQFAFAQRTGQQNNQSTNQQGEEVLEEEGGLSRRSLLDDSTKMVYGPKTSLYFFEKDIKRNNLILYPQDTSLNNFHNYDPVAKNNWKYQDLGNIGSATKPMFYEIPDVIGTRTGFGAYDLYFHAPEDNKYFDTKSPFTEMSALFGGGHRNMLDLAFARNVNPRWNVGFEFHTIRARKTLNPSARDDNMVIQNSYSLHTNYRSENGRYWFLGNFSRMLHKVNEIGGIIPPEEDSTSVYFTYEDAKVWLSNSQARDLRQEYRFYHEFKLRDELQVYHIFDQKNKDLIFDAALTTSDSLFYPSDRLNGQQDTTRNFSDFKEWGNEMGFKGSFKGFYYNTHVKFRTGRMKSTFFPEKNTFNEVYLGGELIGKISEKWSISADGEYLIPGAFKLHGLFISPWLDIDYTKAVYKPTSVQQIYYGNHYQWENDFDNTGVDQVKGVFKLDFEKIRLRPSLTINRVNNYVYFNEKRIAEQASGEAFMLIPGVKAEVRIGQKFQWDTELIFTEISGEASDKFRIPQFYGNTKFYFDSPMFNENVYVQLGLDIRYHSDYFAEAYFPSTQQFYLQNDFNVYGYPVADVFLDFRINRTRVLVKYHHLNSGLMNEEGYFVTPDYTGYKSFIDLGITWYLFD